MNEYWTTVDLVTTEACPKGGKYYASVPGRTRVKLCPVQTKSSCYRVEVIEGKHEGRKILAHTSLFRPISPLERLAEQAE